MPLPSYSTPGTTPTTNFADEVNKQPQDSCSGLTTPRERRDCRRRQRGGTEIPSGPGTAPSPGLGAGSQYNPSAQQGGVHTTGVAPSQYSQDVASSSVTAPAGSYAADLGVYGLPTAAQNPEALVQNYMSGTYGVGSNSMATGIAGKYLSPTADRVQAILGELPGNNIDAANFGAALLQQGNSMGTQLDPKAMISTIVKGIQTAGAGPLDPSSVGPGTFASVVANPDPIDGLNTLLSMMAGALVGTMSDVALGSYLDSLKAYAMQSITGSGGLMNQSLGQIAGDEGAGRGWFDNLVATLGPTLGL